VSTPNPPPPGYASDPQLIMLWSRPPDLTGIGGQASGSSDNMPAMSNPVTVSLATTQAAEQAMLDAGAEVVGAYNGMELEVQVGISQGTIFGQQATYNTSQLSGVHEFPDYHVPDTSLQSSAEDFAAQMNPAMTRVLRLIADGMQTVGVYIAMLNNAGQIYTGTDQHSVIPPPPAPGGGG
jgi:hypothetical protein